MASPAMVSTKERLPSTRPSAPLPLPDRPPSHARVETFVRSQLTYLDYYQREGLALFEAWIEEQAQLDKEAAAESANDGRMPQAFVPAPSEGLHAIDVLGNIRESGASGGQRAAGGKGSSGSGRIRIVDRMKGKDGEDRRWVSSGGKIKESKKEDKVERGGSEIVLTRRELNDRETKRRKPVVDKEHVDPLSQPLKPSPSAKRLSPEPDDPHLLISTEKRRRLDPNGSELPSPSEPEQAASASSHRLPLSPLPKTSRPRPLETAPVSPPTRISATRTKSKPSASTSKKEAKSSIKPGTTSIKKRASSRTKEKEKRKEVQPDHDADHVVRLEDRKRRRREKAAILKPKAAATRADRSGDASSSDDDPAEDDDQGDGQRNTGSETKDKRGKGSGPNARRGVTKDKQGRKEGSSREMGKKDKGKKREREAKDLGKAAGLLGLGVMDHFKATNVGTGRLTLRPAVPKLGVFNNGKASYKVLTSYQPRQDLVFSEVRFLNKNRPLHPPPSASNNDDPLSDQSAASSRRKTRRSHHRRLDSNPPVRRRGPPSDEDEFSSSSESSRRKTRCDSRKRKGSKKNRSEGRKRKRSESPLVHKEEEEKEIEEEMPDEDGPSKERSRSKAKKVLTRKDATDDAEEEEEDAGEAKAGREVVVQLPSKSPFFPSPSKNNQVASLSPSSLHSSARSTTPITTTVADKGKDKGNRLAYSPSWPSESGGGEQGRETETGKEQEANHRPNPRPYVGPLESNPKAPSTSVAQSHPAPPSKSASSFPRPAEKPSIASHPSRSIEQPAPPAVTDPSVPSNAPNHQPHRQRQRSPDSIDALLQGCDHPPVQTRRSNGRRPVYKGDSSDLEGFGKGASGRLGRGRLKTSLSRLDEEMDEEDDEVAVEELFGETYPSRLDRNVEQEACAELELSWRTERVTRFASHDQQQQQRQLSSGFSAFGEDAPSVSLDHQHQSSRLARQSSRQSRPSSAPYQHRLNQPNALAVQMSDGSEMRNDVNDGFINHNQLPLSPRPLDLFQNSNNSASFYPYDDDQRSYQSFGGITNMGYFSRSPSPSRPRNDDSFHPTYTPPPVPLPLLSSNRTRFLSHLRSPSPPLQLRSQSHAYLLQDDARASSAYTNDGGGGAVSMDVDGEGGEAEDLTRPGRGFMGGVRAGGLVAQILDQGHLGMTTAGFQQDRRIAGLFGRRGTT